MSEKDYLEEVKQMLDGPVSDRIIVLCLLDIAKTLREIKAMAERETENDQ